MESFLAVKSARIYFLKLLLQTAEQIYEAIASRNGLDFIHCWEFAIWNHFKYYENLFDL